MAVIISLFFPLVALLIFVSLSHRLILSQVEKRRKQWIRALAAMVVARFNPLAQLEGSLTRPENFEKLKPLIEDHMDDFLRNRLKDQMPMIAMFIGDKTITSLKTIFIGEIEKLFPRVIGNFAGNLQQEFDLEKMIISKLEEIPPEDIQTRLRVALKKPLRRLYGLALLIGLIMGALQALLLFGAG